jgi:lipid II:glycine glycyltransferase (peptidoglycan interpeptide bridge formation enzyme)
MHPEITWELGINIPEQELLANMRKTTRYLIRQAEKNPDIEIIQSQNIEDLKLFWPVYRETAKRHNFVVFSKRYLQDEFEIFSKDGQVSLFLGKYRGQVVSAAIFVFWQEMCFYHHSGSLSKYNKIPVSYLLQWRAISEAKRRGCKIYNFWGIDPVKKTIKDLDKKNILETLDKRHPWYGLSMFKIGFGGCIKEYIKTQDLVISPQYWVNYVIEFLRKRKRKL